MFFGCYKRLPSDQVHRDDAIALICRGEDLLSTANILNIGRTQYLP